MHKNKKKGSGGTTFYFKIENEKFIDCFIKMTLYYNGIGLRVDKHEKETLERLATDDVRDRLKYSSATTILQTYIRFLDNTSRRLRYKFGNEVDLSLAQCYWRHYREPQMVWYFAIIYLLKHGIIQNDDENGWK